MPFKTKTIDREGIRKEFGHLSTMVSVYAWEAIKNRVLKTFRNSTFTIIK